MAKGTVTESAPETITFARGDMRVLAALCVSSFLAALNFFATTPFYSVMARDLNTTIPLLGQIVTLMVVISAILGIGVGPIADRYGYRWPLVLGLVAVGLNLLGTSLAPNYPVLLAFGLLGGLADAIVFGVPLAIAGTRFSGDARRRAFGWTVGAVSSAPIVGIPVLTAISSVAGWRGAVAVAGLGAMLAAWFVARSLPADSRRVATRLRVLPLLAAYAPLLRHYAILRLFGVATLRAVWWLGLLTYLGAFLTDAVGLEASQVGIAYALTGAGYAAGSVLAGGRLGAASPRLTIAAACVVSGLLLGPAFAASNPWLVVTLLVVISMAAAICSIGVTTLLSVESPAGAGTTMVLNSSLLNAGAAGGAVLGGFLIAFGGYAALGLGLPLFSLAAAGLALWPSKPRDDSAV
jgi:DHA1 family inner membrane transport protein